MLKITFNRVKLGAVSLLLAGALILGQGYLTHVPSEALTGTGVTHVVVADGGGGPGNPPCSC